MLLQPAKVLSGEEEEEEEEEEEGDREDREEVEEENGEHGDTPPPCSQRISMIFQQ